MINNIAETDFVEVWVDPLRLKQVLANLLSNAIKYNHPNGTVILEGRQTPHNTYQLMSQRHRTRNSPGPIETPV